MKFHLGLLALLMVTLLWQGGQCTHTSPTFDSGKDDLGSFSKEDLSQLLDEIINRRQTRKNECIDQFEIQPALIIRTRDSMKNGAEFLSAPATADTESKCQLECCKTYSKNLTRPCDLAVFQEKDDDPSDSQPKCFLFSCTKNGKFSCLTSMNKDYSVFRRTAHGGHGAEDQLINIATSGHDSATEILTTSATPMARVPTTASTVAMTAMTTTTVTRMSDLTTAQKTSVEDECMTSCSRLQWKCDNGCCVSVKNVCDSKSDCSDGSDESMCDDGDEKPEHGRIIDEATTSTAATVKETSPASTQTRQQSSGNSNPTFSDKNGAAVQSFGAAVDEDIISERTSAQRGAVLPLALGLSVTACVLLMVVCRLRIMKKKLHRKGKPLTMEESDYLINGMYL